MCGKLKCNKQTDGQTQRKAIDPSAETDSSPITALSFNKLPRGADNGVPYAARQLWRPHHYAILKMLIVTNLFD